MISPTNKSCPINCVPSTIAFSPDDIPYRVESNLAFRLHEGRDSHYTRHFVACDFSYKSSLINFQITLDLSNKRQVILDLTSQVKSSLNAIHAYDSLPMSSPALRLFTLDYE